MKEWIFGGGVILVGAAVVWLVTSGWQQGRSVPSVSPQAAEAATSTAPSKTESVKPVRETRRERKGVSRTVVESDVAPNLEAVVTPPPPVREVAVTPPKPPIFAHVGELRRGLDRTEIQNRFGEPDWRASKSERGSLLETFVYRRKGDGRIVAISLKNGAVERVQSEIP